MSRRFLPVLPIMAAVIVAFPAHAQQQPESYDYQRQQQPAPGKQPESYDYQGQPQSYGYQQQPAYNYGQQNSAYYEFDRGLLNAVNGCAYRAARRNLGRVIVRAVDRVDSNRFRVSGFARWGGYLAPGSGPGSVSPYGYGYPPYRASFTCTADAWGRVINWTTDRR